MSAALWPWLLALFTIPVMIWQWRRTRRQMIERLYAELQRRIAERVLQELGGAPPSGSPGLDAKNRCAGDDPPCK